MIRVILLTRIHHVGKCLIGEARRRVLLIVFVCFTLLLLRILIHNYGCNYISPARMPVNLSSTYVNQFLIEEPDFCKRESDLSMIAYIHSSLAEVEKRRETRLTWASAGIYDPSVKMAVVFMVGLAKTESEKVILQEESQRYHDIVQGNYTDTYHMLSYKALSSLNWITRHCSDVPWTIHADDDVLIDVFLLKKIIENNGTRENLFCYPWDNSPVKRFGKWCVRSDEYSEDIYPIYCAGGAWVMATPLGQRLLEAAGRVPMLWVDDAYLTGLLVKSAGLTISNSIKESIKIWGIQEDNLGKIVVWFNPQKSRTIWWYKLLSYYGHVP